MKKLIIILIAIVIFLGSFGLDFGSVAWAERFRREQTLREDVSGKILSGATVTVYLAGTSTPATIYTDKTTQTPLANSQTTTDSKGRYKYYVDNNDYSHTQFFKEVITKTGYSPITYDDIDILDIEEPWINSRNYPTLEEANTAAYDAGKILLIAQNYTLTANTTLTAAVKVIKGGSFTKASTYTLAINGPLEVGLYQVFWGFSAGDVTGLREIYVENFGTDATAFNCAIQAASKVKFVTDLTIATKLTGKSNLTVESEGLYKRTITYTYEQQAGDPAISEADGVSLFYFADGIDNVIFRNLKLAYTGTFDTGSSYSGKIAGIKFGQVDNVLLENIETTGFNHSGVHIRNITDVTNYSPNITIRKSKLHGNRVAGVWFADTDGILIDDCDIYENYLPTDSGTGYGLAGTTGTITGGGWPINSTVRDSRVYDNPINIDFHAGNHIDILYNFCWKTAGFVGAVQDKGINLEEIKGQINIVGNHLWGFADRGLAVANLIVGIEVGYNYTGTAISSDELVVNTRDNHISGFNVTGGNQRGHGILFNLGYADLVANITGNTIKANNIWSFYTGNLATTGTTPRVIFNFNGNTFQGTTLGYYPFSTDKISSFRYNNNHMKITTGRTLPTLGYDYVFALNKVDGITTLEEIIDDNIFTVPENMAYSLSNYFNQTGKNIINENIIVSQLRGYWEMNLAATPTYGYWKQGSKIWNTEAAAGGSPGWICVYSSTGRTMRIQAVATDTTLEVNSTTGFVSGDLIGVVMDNGVWHWSTINVVVDADTVTINDAVPAGRTLDVGRALFVFRFKAMANLAA